MKGFRPKTPAEREERFDPRQQAAAWNRFFREARRLGRHWQGCMACPPERRDPTTPLEVHHVIDKARLKRWCRERGIAKGSLAELEILTDPRNSMLVDEQCHHLHTFAGVHLPREAISDYAWEFAAEMRLTAEVMEEYPSGGGR